MLLRARIIGGILLVGIISCLCLFIYNRNPWQSTKSAQEPVACVGNQYLYKKDLEHALSDTTHPYTSMHKEQYIQDWICKQLMVAAAIAHPSYNKIKIDNQVLDYQNELIIHYFLEAAINEQLDTTLSDEEIQAYYEQHKRDFSLPYTIVQGKLVVLPQDAPNRTQIRSLMQSHKKKDYTALRAYCAQFAKKYALDTSIWHRWDDLIKDIKLNNIHVKNAPKKNKRFIELVEGDTVYYLSIHAYKLVHSTPPLAWIQKQIATIILHQRKEKLTQQIKETILQNAKEKKEYSMY